jgi:hypothetical protein
MRRNKGGRLREDIPYDVNFSSAKGSHNPMCRCPRVPDKNKRLAALKVVIKA